MDPQLRSAKSTTLLPASPLLADEWMMAGVLRAANQGSVAAGLLRAGLALREEHAARRSIVQEASPHAAAAPVLDEQAFMVELAREKQRADRTQAPLSLIVFRFHEAIGDRSACTARLLALLARRCRRTDVLGRLDGVGAALLLPDTGGIGAAQFLAGAVDDLAELPVSIDTAAYPHCLFDQLFQGRAAVRAPGCEWVSAPAESAVATYPGKRAFDLIVGSLALVLLSPVMLAAALAIASTSRGPIVFRQSRLGQGGRPFTLYKFRSMTVDGDDSVHRAFVTRLIEGQVAVPRDGAVSYKLGRDPRVTAVGRVLRKTSIDELPQLLNVLRGEMSMVGARPPLPYEVAKYRSWHLRRILTMKPGITGIWQVEGRSRVPFDEMVRMDLRYVRRCSLWLDLTLLFKTVVVVLRCDGAS